MELWTCFAGEGHSNETSDVASAGGLTPTVLLNTPKRQDVPDSLSFKAPVEASEVPEASRERQSDEWGFVDQYFDRGWAVNGGPKQQGFVAMLKGFPGSEVYAGAFTLGLHERKKRIRESEVETSPSRMERNL